MGYLITNDSLIWNANSHVFYQCSAYIWRKRFCATSGCERKFREYIFDTKYWNSCEMLIVYWDNTFEIQASLELLRTNTLCFQN